MQKHEVFTQWARSQGVELHGVAAHEFPGRGLGIVATERHEAGKILITVPTGALRTPLTVPKSVSKPLGSITVHGLLAADLSLDTSSTRAPWTAVLPSPEDFRHSMPILWSSLLQSLLPPAVAALLSNQEKKFAQDWAAVSAAFPSLSKDRYLYSWLLVNTRTFYYTAPITPKRPRPKDPNECMALNPFADYFNHACTGCVVEFSPAGFEITANRVCEVGEEIYISYGKHSNDFLLAEYGFIMDENECDEVCLDELLLQEMTKEQKEMVKDAGFLGNYALDREGVCYRTQVALRALCVPGRRWQRFVTGEDDGEKDQPKADELLSKLLKQSELTALDTIDKLSPFLNTEDEYQAETLIRRWKQILHLVRGAIKHASC